MVVIMKPGTPKDEIDKIKDKLESYGLSVHPVIGKTYCILGLIGDTSSLDPGLILANRNVDRVSYVQESFKKANRLFHPENTVVDVDGKKIGGNRLTVIAGPCAVESENQIISIAHKVKSAGADFLRGGAYKPRTSPYSFQGLKEEGLDALLKAKDETGLPIVTEIMNPRLVDKFEEKVDIIQIGARNMQNFDLLKEIGKTKKPVLLKRGLSSTVEELLMAAEYIMSEGNQNVILCERGIRTFENYTRNTLDISAVPLIKKHSHLPVLVDPSHSAGTFWLVEPLAKASVAAGADGLIIEVHEEPDKALSDGQQSIKPEAFGQLMRKIETIASVENRDMPENYIGG